MKSARVLADGVVAVLIGRVQGDGMHLLAVAQEATTQHGGGDVAA